MALQNPFINLGLTTPKPNFNVPALPQQQQAPMQQVPEPQFTPQTSMQNMFARLIQESPQPNNPSKWRKLAAALGSIGSQDPFASAQRMAYSPYFNQMETWKQKLPFVQQAADNERQSNQVGYSAFNQERTRALNERKQDEVENKNRQTLDLARTKEERQQKLATLQEIKYKNPHLKFDVVNGKLLVLNPADGQVTDTGISGMSDLEKLTFTADAAMDRVNAQQSGANSRNAATIAGANERAGQVYQGADGKTYRFDPVSNSMLPVENAPTGTLTRPGTPPRSTGINGQSELERARALRNRAQELIFQNPTWAKYINMPTTTNGLVTVKPVGRFTGPDKATFDAINSALSGVPNPGMAGRDTTLRKTQTNTATGAKRTVISTDGGKTWRPE